MTESQTRHEAIVTPSSSLLRTVVSTMGTLTFTSVASFYYYYYRQTSAMPRSSSNMGVVLFQSMASLWGWPNKKKRSLSAERRRRKKSKSPGRKQREAESSSSYSDERVMKEAAEFNEIARVFDAVPDHQQQDRVESSNKDVCVQQLFHDERDSDSVNLSTFVQRSHFKNKEVICEDASDEDCSMCHDEAGTSETFHQDGDLNVERESATNDTTSAYGIQELAFQFTANVVENYSLAQVQVIELGEEEAVDHVKEAETSNVLPQISADDEQITECDVPASVEEVLLADIDSLDEENLTVAVPNQKVTIVDDIDVLQSDDSCCLPVEGGSNIKESSPMMILGDDEEEVASVSDDDRVKLLRPDDYEDDPTSQSIVMAQDEEEQATEDECILEDSFEDNVIASELEPSMVVEENNAIRLIQQADEVMDTVLREPDIESENSNMMREGEVSRSRVIASWNEPCITEASPLSSKIVENEVVKQDGKDPSPRSLSSTCICEEDPALVSDDEGVQGGVASNSHEGQYIDDGSEGDDDASSTIDCEASEGSSMPLRRELGVSPLTSEEVSDAESTSDSAANELSKHAIADDDIPGILQLDTLTFDDTSATGDDVHTDLEFSSSPMNMRISEKVQARSSSYIGNISIFLLCGGMVLMSLYYPRDNAELRVESEPKSLNDIESYGVFSLIERDDSNAQVAFDIEADEMELPNMTSVSKATAFFEFDTTFSEMSVANSIVQVVFEPDTVEIKSLNVSSVPKQPPMSEFVLPSVQIERSSEDSLSPVRKTMRQKLFEMSKSKTPPLLGPCEVYFGTKLIQGPFDLRQMLSMVKTAILSNGRQAVLSQSQRYFESVSSFAKSTVPPMQMKLQEMLTAIRSPVKLSKTASEAFLVSHGVFPKSLIFSSERVSIAELITTITLSTTVQTSLKQPLNKIRAPLRVSQSAKDAFKVSHGVVVESLIVSPVSLDVKSLLQELVPLMKLSSDAKEVVLASYGLYNAPMTLLPEPIDLLYLACKILERSREAAGFQLNSVSSAFVQHYFKFASSTKSSATTREVFMGSHGVYGKESLHLAPAKKIIDDTFMSIQRRLEQILVEASLSNQLSTTAREAFIGSHGMFDEATLNLAPAKDLIDDSLSKLSKTLQHAVLKMYLDLLNRVPEQRIVFRDIASTLAAAAGKANRCLRRLYSESFAVTVAIQMSIEPFLKEPLSLMNLSDGTKDSMLGFHGEYFEHYDFESTGNAGDRQMLFLELWSTLTSCSYFLDHSVVLWSKVGDEVIHLLNQDWSS